jgi:hypothetical protein
LEQKIDIDHTRDAGGVWKDMPLAKPTNGEADHSSLVGWVAKRQLRF